MCIRDSGFCFFPIFMIVMGGFGSVVKKATTAKLEQLKILGGQTEETFAALKLIVSFAQEEVTLKRYNENAAKTCKIAQKFTLLQGTMNGLFMMAMFGFTIYCYAVASQLTWKKRENPITGEPYEINEMISVIYAVMMSCMVFPQVLPLLPSVIGALVSTKKIYDVIERVPEIKSEQGCQERINLDQGINFENITFRYKSQADSTQDIFCLLYTSDAADE